MPLDLFNIPFFRRRGNDTLQKMLSSQVDTTLKMESILLEEFNFVSVTAYQLKEERSRVFNLYLLIMGILASGMGTVAALLTQKDFNRVDLLMLAVFVLLLAGLLSLGFFIRLLDLSCKYRESLVALNQIKDFYIQHMPQIKQAFWWRLDNIPRFGRFGSAISFMGATVATIGSVYLSAAVLLVLNNFVHPDTPYNGYFQVFNVRIPILNTAIVVPLFISLMLGHYLYYRLIRKKAPR